jgi:G3E family GTPase
LTDFTLLTGFLGSGKTTLLVDYLRQPEAADTAVIVNEAGEIDIDGAVIAADAGELPMALLANGCVCCSIANDLLYTVEALIETRARAGAPPFRRIVLETSGLARPGPIIRALGELAPYGMRLGVLATCDAAAPPFAEATLPTAAAQLGAAGTIVLTKLDRAGAATLDARLAGINPLAARIVEPDPARRALAAFAAVAPLPPSELPEAGHPAIVVLTAEIEGASFAAILDWLENLAGLAGDRLLRLKGTLIPDDIGRSLLFQAVGTAFAPPRPFAGPATGLVLIVHDLPAADIAAMQPGFPLRLRPQPGPFAPRAARLRAT